MWMHVQKPVRTEVNHSTCNVSNSYLNAISFLEESRLNDPGCIYFHADKPRFPLPNVYCFNKEGKQLHLPANAFQDIAYFIRLLDDGKLLPNTTAESLATFLAGCSIVNAYDEIVTVHNIGPADRYLFIDFIPMYANSVISLLKTAACQALLSKHNIKLLLVNAMSEKNQHLYVGRMPASINQVGLKK